MLEVQGERQTRLIRQTDTGEVQKVGWLCNDIFRPVYLIYRIKLDSKCRAESICECAFITFTPRLVM
jgi:hypothetical protein